MFWCESHQCWKTPHWHHLCRTRPDYLQLWQLGRGPGQFTPDSPPTAATRITTRQSPGLGDRVSQALAIVGITESRVTAWLGRPCGCGKRREMLNRLGDWAAGVLGGRTEAAARELEVLIEDPPADKHN